MRPQFGNSPAKVNMQNRMVPFLFSNSRDFVYEINSLTIADKEKLLRKLIVLIDLPV